MAARTKKTPYSVHPGVETNLKWIASLKDRTGRSLAEWLDFIEKRGPADERARREWLKTEQGLGTNAALWLAERSFGKGDGEDTPEDYLKTAANFVEEMYSGGKEGLKPIYESILKIGLKLGRDVRICPCKTMVPFYRNHVFAEVKPGTRTRIDFGLALARYSGRLPKRLLDTGGAAKKDRITHKIEVTSLQDLDDELKRWLKVAYDLDSVA